MRDPSSPRSVAADTASVNGSDRGGGGGGGPAGAGGPTGSVVTASDGDDDEFGYANSVGRGGDNESVGDHDHDDVAGVPSLSDVAALGRRPGNELSSVDQRAILKEHKEAKAAAAAAAAPPMTGKRAQRTRAAMDAASNMLGTRARGTAGAGGAKSPPGKR